MNQSFCQGTSITITIHAGKCLNMAVGESLTPSRAPGTQTWGVPTSIGAAHQCRRCPGPGPHGQRQSQALGQRWLKDGAVGNPSKLSGGVTEGWLTQRETCHLLTLAAPGIFPENSYSKTHTELHWFTGKGSSKRRVITQNEKLDLLTGLSLFALHGLDFSFYSAKLL